MFFSFVEFVYDATLETALIRHQSHFAHLVRATSKNGSINQTRTEIGLFTPRLIRDD
jgi:hypothetical protein